MRYPDLRHRSREELAIEILAVCQDMIDRGEYPAVKRIAALVHTHSAVCNEIRRELIAARLINPEANRHCRSGLCGIGDAEKREIEAAKDAAREEKAKACDAAREKVLEAGGTVGVTQSRASTAIGLDGCKTRGRWR
jgi:hypothetical protein